MSSHSEIIKCIACAKLFTWEIDGKPGGPFFDLMRPDHCPACAEIVAKHEQEQQLRREVEARHKQIDSLVEEIRAKIPDLFHRTDIKHPRFNSTAWCRIKEWRPTFETPWLGLYGETGTSKTRIAYLIAMEIVREIATRHFATFRKRQNPTAAFATSYDIAEAVMAQFAGKIDTGHSSFDDRPASRQGRAFLDRIRDADLVLIDDMGKGRLSPAVAAEMFALVDHRYAHALPMIWTSNSTPEAIARSLSEDLAGPFAGRLNDSSRIFKFK